DVAPDFELRDQNNQRVRLSRLLDDRQVLIVFFPLAFTGTCQGELGFIRDNYQRFVNDEVAAVTVSVGPPPTHKVWSSA
ncbi:redoxin domain-containing protein, partial [Mycobacterium tuberculosis]|uniref:redoxin domain-containing protein n=1 Tax=Mycobacterium tuberculosis TaxID=1773 RepID=UPI001AE2265E|nr:redoxin domain-containing protein [Mycobacterium tuberculosis]